MIYQKEELLGEQNNKKKIRDILKYNLKIGCVHSNKMEEGHLSR